MGGRTDFPRASEQGSSQKAEGAGEWLGEWERWVGEWESWWAGWWVVLFAARSFVQCLCTSELLEVISVTEDFEFVVPLATFCGGLGLCWCCSPT